MQGDFAHREDYDTGYRPHSARLADLDDDGDLDIVTVDYHGDTISILMNDGEGIFSKENEYQAGDGPGSISLGDVDGDSDTDIVCANYHGNTVSVFKNDGSGTFTPAIVYDVGDGPFSIFLADIGEDSNGDLDLVTVDNQDEKVSVLENNGNGEFSNINTYKVGSRPKGIFLDDLDGDGYNDIAVANWIDDTVSVLINKGDGTFKKHVEYITGTWPRSIFLADVNGDNIPDMATANQNSYDISILLNNGDGTFASKMDYNVGENPLCVLLNDVDDDGDLDVLTANRIDDTISLLKNDGTGNFQGRADYDTDQGPYSIVVGDVNGDGEKDMVTANSDADTVSIRYSNFPPSIIITNPDGVDDIVANSYTIAWQDYDPEDDAAIALYWDDDAAGFDGTLIASSLSEDDDGVGGRYVWDISALPEDDYWIYATISDGIFNSRNDYSSGPLTIDRSIVQNVAPTFQIIEPNGNDDYADKDFTIVWMDSDPDDDASISLFYDSDQSGYDGVMLAEGLSEDNDGSSGYYTWNTAAVSNGNYYIYGVCDDGVNEQVRVYSSYPVIVNHTSVKNSSPFIQIVEPDGEDDIANMEYMISWIDSDSDDDASISLYYDTDASGYDGTLIISGLSEDGNGNSGMFVWDTSSISEGKYYVYAIITDEIEAIRDYSLGPITVTHSTTVNTAPNIQITEPDGNNDNANLEYMITWIDSDPDSNASISLYYDTDVSGYDGTLIISDLSEDEHGNSGIFIWNTSSISEGKFYIYAIIEDEIEVIRNYSPGMITITHSTTINTAPNILIVSPGKGVENAKDNYTIRWLDSDPDDDASISLYYDKDNSGYDGTLIISNLSEDDGANSYIWNVKEMPNGEYHIYGKIDDGINAPVYDYSDGNVSIGQNITDTETGDDLLSKIRNYLPCLILIWVLILVLLILFLMEKGGNKEDRESENGLIDSDKKSSPKYENHKIEEDKKI